MPAPKHSVFYRPDVLPATKTNSIKALKADYSGKIRGQEQHIKLHKPTPNSKTILDFNEASGDE